MTMPEILVAFTAEPLFAAASNLLSYLGVKFSTQTEEPIPFLEFYEDAAREANATIPKDVKAIFSRVANTYFIGTVTDDTLKGDNAAVDFKAEAAKPKYEGMFVFAVEMKPGETLKRSEAAVIVRGINRVVKQQPATVLILEDAQLSVATCERTAFKQAWRPGERLGKVSILKGIDCHHPHRGHVDILESMDVKGYKTFDALYTHWKDVFSTKLLTKQFYREIQNWYFWALKKDSQVAFPNALDSDSDNGKYNPENLIRLITRLIFTWFMKEKGLVNPALFDAEFLATALKYFNPDGVSHMEARRHGEVEENLRDSVAPCDHDCTYYRAILQNLFFATFNQEVGLRDFANPQFRDAKRYNVKNYYRNEKLFTETDRAKIIGYFNGSPFVNGGLFECLDNVEQNGCRYSWDGFSNHVHFKNGSLKSALIPDRLFFGGETTVDLSEFFEKDKSAKCIKVRGIINILKDYVFTIEENTPFDEDVALDPELLGKVFENLLGCYNPETRQMARNATGSFYTPREIVNYMVKVSLKSYLQRVCPQVTAAEIDALVEGTAELAELPSVKENAKDILTALFKAKILDPACGSGAFPMGIMSAMVEILRTVDPDNKHWYEIVLKESLDEATAIADISDERERSELKAQIEYDFKERLDHPDYARKLYLIEHCIFGSDIQPIAVQISRLRFFITLLCEQAKNDNPAKNYGITPLPNLESNFVAANSLLSIDLKDMRELLGQKKIVSLVKQLRGIRHQLFLPKTSDRKKRLQAKDVELRGAIASAAEGLYDANIELKCAMLKTDIKRCDEELAKLGEDDFKDVVKEVEEVDLFGNKTVTQKKVVGRGNELLKKKKNAESLLASLMNASRKERLLTDVKRLVAWNPFAFNVAESFLDPEWMFGVKNGFDIVIGNPPYIRRTELPASDKKEYENYYFSADGQYDIYLLFIELGLKCLREHGHLCYINPIRFYNSDYGIRARTFISQNYCVRSILDVSQLKVFETALTYPCIMVYENNCSAIDGNMIEYRRLSSLDEIASIGTMLPLLVSQDWIRNDSNKRFLMCERHDLDMIDKMAASSNPTESIFTNGRGLANSVVEFNLCRYRGLKSKGVKRYYMDESYLLDMDSIRAKSFHPEMVIMPRTVERIISTLKPRDVVLLDRIYYLTPRRVVSHTYLAYVVASLNSAITDWWFRKIYETTKVSGGYFDLNGKQIESIPIPNATNEQQKCIAAKVDAILAAKKADPNADTSALEAEIDDLVFDLYGLTPEEREIVKGGGK